MNVSELLRLLQTEHDETAARADSLREQIERFAIASPRPKPAWPRLDSLLTPEARWLWEQLAVRADRCGEPSMTGGTTVITAPAAPRQRAAVLGLVGSRILAPGERRRIQLKELTLRLRQHGSHLTPGTVAAHAAGRALGCTAAERARQIARTTRLRQLRARLTGSLPGHARLRPADEGRNCTARPCGAGSCSTPRPNNCSRPRPRYCGFSPRRDASTAGCWPSEQLVTRTDWTRAPTWPDWSWPKP
ncbi:hypothetical protein [Streptomyces sp. NPDC001966]